MKINVENLFNPSSIGYVTFDATEYEPYLVQIDSVYYEHTKITDSHILAMKCMQHELKLLGIEEIEHALKISRINASNYAMNHLRVEDLDQCSLLHKIEEIRREILTELYWAAWSKLIDTVAFKTEFEALKQRIAKQCAEYHRAE